MTDDHPAPPGHGARASQQDHRAASASRQIDALIARLDDWRGAQLAEVRALIRAADPQVEEQWRWMGTPTFARDGIYAIANPHKGKVKITFGHGAELPDPYGLFNAGLGGKKWRAIDLFEGDRLNKTAFKQLVRAAVKEHVARAKAKEGTKGKA